MLNTSIGLTRQKKSLIIKAVITKEVKVTIVITVVDKAKAATIAKMTTTKIETVQETTEVDSTEKNSLQSKRHLSNLP